ncbi:1302_t:CDS:2 [Diversispora eburnea]|uniref:1302_t:CDS:1 n=1 Tax=Diversispora eburnea TaxID=1213867 RepID=A0A9N9EYD0_9GLOM|nr:1302_t:CDS:2 [Diversispora eburnea]
MAYKEIEHDVEIATSIIRGSELEELRLVLELNSWGIAEHYLKEYGRKKRICGYRVEFDRKLNMNC